MTDEELVKEYCETNSEQVFEELLKRYSRTIYQYTRNRYYNQRGYIDLEDIQQECRIMLWSLAKKYNDVKIEKDFKGYLINSIKYTAHITNRVRRIDQDKKYFYAENSYGDAYEDNEIQDIASCDSIGDLEKTLFNKELREELENIMFEKLSLKESAIIKLFFGWDDEKVPKEQIAKLLNLTNYKVNYMLCSGLKKIRQTEWYKREMQYHIDEKTSNMKNGYESIVFEQLKNKYLL